jgi:ribonuclease HIII
MNEYTKIFSLLVGPYFTKEYQSIKHHKNKLRPVLEDTVAESFLAFDAVITVIFEETGKTIVIDAFTDEEIIKAYLGKKFIKQAKR